MQEAFHRIKVFPFQVKQRDPLYLLLRPDQEQEGIWGPVEGEVGFGDQIEQAARRYLVRDVGVNPPGSLLDMSWATRTQFGDELIIEWCFGYECHGDPDPNILAKHWADHRWAGFGEAYQALEIQADRTAMMRLHAMINAA